MRNPWKLTSLVLAAGLAAATLTTTASADRQPRMRDALRVMVAARAKLDHAAADKGGHRVKALELLDGAITEVEAGIQFDNSH